MKNKVPCFFLLVMVILFLCCKESKQYDNNRPNFLIIQTDNLGYSDIGIYGSEIATPNIDQLAKEGIQYTNFHTSQGDSPSKAMLLTGTSEGLSENARHLKVEAITIAELLGETGYRTFMSGKWNLGKDMPHIPISKGFQKSFFISEERSGHIGNKRYLPAIFREDLNIKEISEDFYSTQYFTRKMLSYLSSGKRKERRKPFFAYLSYTAPNAPLQAPANVIKKYKGKYDGGYQAIYNNRVAKQQQIGIMEKNVLSRKLPDWEVLSAEGKNYEAYKMEIYAAMIDDIDRQIGKIIDYLKISKKYENTVIFFLSDNGVGEQKFNQKLEGLDNTLDNIGKANSMVTLGEGWTSVKMENKKPNSLKVPFILSSPIFKNKANSKEEELRNILDIAPTILELAGVVHPSESYFSKILPMEGVSFRASLLF